VIAIHAGILRGCFEEARTYAGDRYQGFQQIIEHGQVRAELGRIAATMLVAEELYRVASQDGGFRPEEACMPAAAQLLVGEMAVESTTFGIQILGGNGYMSDYGQEKRMRDAKQLQGIFGRKDLIIQDLTQALAK
jgi:alkylation response protein AidB-like acyl-CoA dehydrogenase